MPIYYTRSGRGEPVVLLHGFAVQSDLNWRLPGITRALAGELQRIAPDLRGHGRSGKPHDPGLYGVERVEDVVRLLDHLGIERAHIVGYSLGGFIALKLATLYPERVVSLAALGSGWESPENSSFLEAMSGLAEALESGRAIAPLAGNLGEDREPPGRLHTLWVKAMTRYLNDGRALAAMIRALRGITLEREELRGIRAPVLSVVGTRDSLAVGVDAMKGEIADHRIVLVEGADPMQAVRSPELLSALQSFLRAHRTTPPAESRA
ncbi:MAG: alpha/beta fold hydrolase [Myxococcota bacterium]